MDYEAIKTKTDEIAAAQAAVNAEAPILGAAQQDWQAKQQRFDAALLLTGQPWGNIASTALGQVLQAVKDAADAAKANYDAQFAKMTSLQMALQRKQRELQALIMPWLAATLLADPAPTTPPPPPEEPPGPGGIQTPSYPGWPNPTPIPGGVISSQK